MKGVVVSKVWSSWLGYTCSFSSSTCTSKVNMVGARRRFTSICKNQVRQVSIPRCLATADHHFSENRTTAKCVTVEMFAEPGWGEEWGENVWQMDCVALCSGVPGIIYQTLQIIFQVCERTTAKQSAEPCLRISRMTSDSLEKSSWGQFGRISKWHSFVIEWQESSAKEYYSNIIVWLATVKCVELRWDWDDRQWLNNALFTERACKYKTVENEL